MADPATIGMMSMGASAGGSLLGMVSSLMGGDAKSKSFEYKAAIARMNIAVAKQNKEWALKSGETEALRSGMKTGFVLGEMKAKQGASGLDVNKGSGALVRASQHKIGLLDQTTIRENAARRAYGFDVQAANLQAEANAFDVASDNAEMEGYLGAASSLLGGASSVSSKWMQGEQLGMWGGSGGYSGGGQR